MNTVAIAKASQPSALVVASLLDMLESIDLRHDDSIIVKPNLCYHRNPYGMVVTDFKLIEATLAWLKQRSRRVVLAESDNRTGTADFRAEVLGLKPMLQDLEVPFINLSQEKEVLTKNVDDIVFHVPRLVAEADYVVNMPKLKTCAGMTVTLSLKNSFGLVADRNKPSMHKHLDKILLEVNKLVRQHIVLVDGVVGMEGNGPLLGEPVRSEIIVAGRKPASVDSVCSRIIGFDPAKISHIKICSEGSLGALDLDKINVAGESMQSVAKSYEPPSLVPKMLAKTLKSAAKLYLGK